MLLNLRIVSIAFFTSQFLIIVRQCAGIEDVAVCKNNKGTVNIQDDEGSCKCSVTYVQSVSAYKFYGEPYTWNAARKICEKEGSHLAIIESDHERQVLNDLINYYGKSISNEAHSKDHFWLGIHDQFQEGEWSNVFDELLGYAPWAKSSPDCYDNSQPDNTGGQNCGTLVRKCGYMDDVQCDWKLPFFCEKPSKCSE